MSLPVLWQQHCRYNDAISIQAGEGEKQRGGYQSEAHGGSESRHRLVGAFNVKVSVITALRDECYFVRRKLDVFHRSYAMKDCCVKEI